MEPVTTASKAVHTARAAGAALSILPSVFTVIQRASQEFSTSLRPVAFYILALYSSSDRHTVLSEERLACYAVVLLDAVEARVREEVLWNSEACTCEVFMLVCSIPTLTFRSQTLCHPNLLIIGLVQQSHKVFYPKSHALSHVADTNLSNVLSFADSFASHDLARILQDTVDELLLDSSNSPTKPARKRRRGPQWGISKYTGRVFHALHAISQCRCGPDGCGLIEHSKTKARLALATYWNVSKEDPFLDVLFALEPLGTETPLWTEFRIHAHSSESTSPDAGTTPAVSRVAFPDKHVRAASTAPVWRMKTPKQIERFCRLLDPSLPHFRSMYRVNLTLDAADDIWQHVPTARFLDQADLSHFTSLGAILAASGMCEFNNDMTKLMLAAILSYSLFYLYEGPWLRARSAVGWDRESIVFFRKDDMVLLRPFLHSDIRGNASDTSHEDGDDDGIGPFIPDPVLLGFGIILLEIHLGRTLESYLNLTQPLTSVLEKLACAWRVFNKRRTYFPWSGYRDAVEACLSPCLERSDGNSESDTDEQTIEQRRGMIFSKIVSPLQDELERRAEFNADGSKSDINLDAFDEQAASMDLFSGHSAADNLTMRQHHHSSIITSTHEQAISYPQKNSLVTAKAIAIPHISSKKPESLLYASDYPEDAEPGKIYNLFADPGVPLSGSLQDHVATDNWFNLFRDLAIVRTLESVEPREPHRVRVAIIDTGIDMGHVDMLAAISNKQIVKVCDWVDGQEGREDKNMRDSSGHGTHVASIILDMAPNVDLYIARVSKGHMISHNQADNVATVRTSHLHLHLHPFKLVRSFTPHHLPRPSAPPLANGAVPLSTSLLASPAGSNPSNPRSTPRIRPA